MKRQINIIVSEALRRRIKVDAASLDIKLQDWGEAAFAMFLELPAAQRRAIAAKIEAREEKCK